MALILKIYILLDVFLLFLFSDAVIVQIVQTAGLVLTAVFTLLIKNKLEKVKKETAILNDQNVELEKQNKAMSEKIDTVHTQINSRMDEQLKMTKELAKSEVRVEVAEVKLELTKSLAKAEGKLEEKADAALKDTEKQSPKISDQP